MVSLICRRSSWRMKISQSTRVIHVLATCCLGRKCWICHVGPCTWERSRAWRSILICSGPFCVSSPSSIMTHWNCPPRRSSFLWKEQIPVEKEKNLLPRHCSWGWESWWEHKSVPGRAARDREGGTAGPPVLTEACFLYTPGGFSLSDLKVLLHSCIRVFRTSLGSASLGWTCLFTAVYC